MMRAIWFTSLAVLSFVSATSTSGAQRLSSLTDEERDAALALEASAIDQLKGGPSLAPMASFSAEIIPELRATPMGAEGKSVVTGVTSVSPKEAAEATRRAVVTRYDYATGLTFRTVIDLTARQALDIKADPNFPTPLAPEEAERAIEIAAGTVPEIAQPAGGPPPAAPSLLPIIDSLPSSPTYGHRLVVVWRDDLPRTTRVLVDLTTETVINPSY